MIEPSKIVNICETCHASRKHLKTISDDMQETYVKCQMCGTQYKYATSFCGPKLVEALHPASQACNTHQGEHPFFYKIGVNGFVTACGEVYNNQIVYPKRR